MPNGLGERSAYSRPTPPAAPGEGLKGPSFPRRSGSVGQWPAALGACRPPDLPVAREVTVIRQSEDPVSHPRLFGSISFFPMAICQLVFLEALLLRGGLE